MNLSDLIGSLKFILLDNPHTYVFDFNYDIIFQF